MRALPPRGLADEADEYAPIDASGGLTAVSLLCFVAALLARYLVAMLPGEVVGLLVDALPIELPFYRRAALSALAVPAFAFVGLLLGLVGLRRPRSRTVSRLAVFLNAVTLGLGILAVVIIGWIMP